MAVRAPAGLSRIILRAFDGGLNLRDAQGELQNNESPDMMNMTLDERGGVIKRLGYQRDNDTNIFAGETAPSSSSGNEITDTTRATNTSGDGWPYYPYTFDGGGETNLVASTEPWDSWEGLSSANQLFYGTGPTLSNPSVPTPRQGTYWVKYVVRPGDQFGGSSGERSEHLFSSTEGTSQETWFRWSTQFPTDFVRPSGWCIFTQFHSDARYNQSAFKFQIDQVGGVNYVSLVLTCGPFADAAQALSPIESNNLRFSNLFQLTLGVWHDFIMRVRWSATGTGMVQLWHRQEGTSTYTQIINRDSIYTLPSTIGDPTPGSISLKQGLYRNAEPTLTTTVYHDGFARGNSYNELLYTYTPPAAMGTVGIWPATTNLHTNGGCETNTTGWATSGGGITLTRVTTEHYFGTAALQVTMDGSAGSQSAQFSVALTNGQKYSWSAWVKAPAGQRVRIWAVDSVSTNLGQVAWTGTGQWEKHYVTFTATANNNHLVRIGRTATGSSQTVYIDGAQLENLNSETPYVETNGGTAARNAARVQYASGVITATQGFVAAEWRMGWRSTQGLGNGTGKPRHFDWTLDANNYIRCYFDEAADAWKLERKAAGTGSTVTVSGDFVRRQRMVVIAAWTATQIKLSINGFPFTVQADTNIPSGMPANFDLGSSAGTAEHIGSDKKWTAFGSGTLSDADARLLGDSAASPFGTAFPTNLYYSEAFNQLFIQLQTKLYKRTGRGAYTEITRTGPADAFTTAKLVGMADLNGKLYVVHPDDGVLEYTGSGNIAVVNATVKGNSLAMWQNKLWATGATSQVWWSNAGAGATWTTATDFVQVRDVNDDPCTAIGFGQSIDSGSVPESGLLVFKRFSTHRITDSITGAYTTLSAEAGAAGPRAVAHLGGLTMSVNDKGVWVTDGENTPVLASGKLLPFFVPASIAQQSLQNIACGVYRDRFVISLTRVGQSVNDITFEFHPQIGWFAPHSLGMQAYATLRQSDNSLYAMSSSSNPNLVKLFVGGSDDQLANGTVGTAITCRFRTKWLEPADSYLTRIRRVRLQYRGVFDFYARRDFSNGAADLLGATEANVAGASIYGVAVWGTGIYGPDVASTEAYQDIYSLGTAKAWSFELRQTGDDSVQLQQLLQTGIAPESGQVALYELHFDFVPLTYA